MTIKWNFPGDGGGGFKLKNLLWEGYGYFLEQHNINIMYIIIMCVNVSQKI